MFHEMMWGELAKRRGQDPPHPCLCLGGWLGCRMLGLQEGLPGSPGLGG